MCEAGAPKASRFNEPKTAVEEDLGDKAVFLPQRSIRTNELQLFLANQFFLINLWKRQISGDHLNAHIISSSTGRRIKTKIN